MLIIKNRIYNFFSFDIVKVQIHKQWQWFVLYSVSRVLFFRSRHCLSLSPSLWRSLLSRILFFLRSDLFVLSTAEQDRKKNGKFFFEFSRIMLLKIVAIILIRYFSTEKEKKKKEVQSIVVFYLFRCLMMMVIYALYLVAAEFIKHNERLWLFVAWRATLSNVGLTQRWRYFMFGLVSICNSIINWFYSINI